MAAPNENKTRTIPEHSSDAGVFLWQTWRNLLCWTKLPFFAERPAKVSARALSEVPCQLHWNDGWCQAKEGYNEWHQHHPGLKYREKLPGHGDGGKCRGTEHNSGAHEHNHPFAGNRYVMGRLPNISAILVASFINRGFNCIATLKGDFVAKVLFSTQVWRLWCSQQWDEPFLSSQWDWTWKDCPSLWRWTELWLKFAGPRRPVPSRCSGADAAASMQTTNARYSRSNDNLQPGNLNLVFGTEKGAMLWETLRGLWKKKKKNNSPEQIAMNYGSVWSWKTHPNWCSWLWSLHLFFSGWAPMESYKFIWPHRRFWSYAWGRELPIRYCCSGEEWIHWYPVDTVSARYLSM